MLTICPAPITPNFFISCAMAGEVENCRDSEFNRRVAELVFEADMSLVEAVSRDIDAIVTRRKGMFAVSGRKKFQATGQAVWRSLSFF